MKKSKPSSNMPLISVIIPVYNGEDVLRRAVDSVRDQTYENLEIIIIDDGSKDKSGELCDRLAEEDSRIRVVHQQNVGLSAARNAGLGIMKGKYVTFVDSDDTIEPSMVKQLFDFMTNAKLDMVTCSFAEVKNGEKSKFNGFGRTSKQIDIYADALKRSSEGHQYILSRASFLTHMLCDDGYTTSAWGKLYQAKLFKKIRFPVGKIYEDMGTTYKVALKCERIGFLDLALYNYYQLDGSIIHQDFSRKKLDLIELTDQACDDIERGIILPVREKSHPDPRATVETLLLEDAIRKRRVHARFSILRQLLECRNKKCRTKNNELYHELVNYAKQHREDILHNPLSSKRDVAAVYVLSSKILRQAYRMAKRR